MGELVIEGVRLEKDASEKELDAFHKMSYQAITVFIQTVSATVSEKIIQLGDPHEMWKQLRLEFLKFINL